MVDVGVAPLARGELVEGWCGVGLQGGAGWCGVGLQGGKHRIFGCLTLPMAEVDQAIGLLPILDRTPRPPPGGPTQAPATLGQQRRPPASAPNGPGPGGPCR